MEFELKRRVLLWEPVQAAIFIDGPCVHNFGQDQLWKILLIRKLIHQARTADDFPVIS